MGLIFICHQNIDISDTKIFDFRLDSDDYNFILKNYN